MSVNRKKWPSPSLRQQAYVLRKRGMTDAEILQKFIQEGKMTKVKAPSSVIINSTTAIPTNLSPDELQKMLMDASVRGLTKPDPDAQWGRILLATMEKTEQLTIPKKPLEIHKYIRPPEYSDKQNLITDYIVGHQIKFLFIVGNQRGGKSTAIFNAFSEMVMKNTTGHPLQFDLMTGTGKQAKRILKDTYNDKIILENNRNQIIYLDAEKAIWWDKSQLDLHEPTMGVKGGTNNVSWCDEFDVTIKTDKVALQTMINMGIANPNMLVIFSSNQDSGIYQYFKQEFEQLSYTEKEVAFVEIFPVDCPWLKEAGNIPLVTKISNILVGKTVTKMRLENKFSGTGDQIDGASLKDAYDIYETLLQMEFKTNKPILECDYRILSIDPSNTGNPFGWILLGVKSQHIIEFEGDMFQMGFDPTGQKWSTERINEFFLKMYRENYCRCILLENNSYGGGLMVYLQNHGVKVEISVRGKEGEDNSLSNFMNVARKVFEDRLLALKNQDLRGQLTQYDPVERGKISHMFKGDIADALINGIWLIVGGMKYMENSVPTLQQSNQKVAWY